MNKFLHTNWKKVLTILCVAAPITAIVIYILNKSGIINIGIIFPFALFLLCILSHLLMIPLMFKVMFKEKPENSTDNIPSCH